MSKNEEEYMYNQKIIKEIVKKDDEDTIKFLRDYAIKNNAELQLIDKDKVEEIIKIGITEYTRKIKESD